jgi:hypothetical protein
MCEADLTDELLREHLSQAAARLPGPDYYEALKWIHDTLSPGTYLEIGVREGASLRVAHVETSCIAIDPAPQLKEPLGPNVRLFDVTSDCFFAEASLPGKWNQGHFDLALIDGLHLFEQALRDFINLERYATPQSIVMIHDCLPLDEVTSSRTRTTQFYSGDIWKMIPALIRWRPDLRMNIIAAPPTGLCLVSNCDPTSTTLNTQYDQIVNTYLSLGFEHYLAIRDSLPELVENTPQAMRNCIMTLQQIDKSG